MVPKAAVLLPLPSPVLTRRSEVGVEGSEGKEPEESAVAPNNSKPAPAPDPEGREKESARVLKELRRVEEQLRELEKELEELQK